MKPQARKIPVYLRLSGAMAVAAAILACASLSNAQSAEPSTVSPSEIAASGERKDSTYRNRHLGMSLTIPSDWSFASEEMNRRIIADGNKKLKENETAERQKAFERSMANTSILFSMTKYPADDARNRAQLIAGYERTPSTSTARSYAEFNKKLVLAKATTPRLLEDIISTRVDGKELLRFDIEVTENGVKVRQTYYVMNRTAGMLFFIVTWVDGGEEERRAFDKVVTSADFDS